MAAQVDYDTIIERLDKEKIRLFGDVKSNEEFTLHPFDRAWNKMIDRAIAIIKQVKEEDEG